MAAARGKKKSSLKDYTGEVKAELQLVSIWPLLARHPCCHLCPLLSIAGPPQYLTAPRCCVQDPHSCALIAAARRGDVPFGMLAIDAGDTVNTVNNDEETALHIALDNGHQVSSCTVHRHLADDAIPSDIFPALCAAGLCSVAALARREPNTARYTRAGLPHMGQRNHGRAGGAAESQRA